MNYYAVKTFKTFNEAIDEVMKSSYSLADSDLHHIRAHDFSELSEVIDNYYSSFDGPSSYGDPVIDFGPSEYPSAVAENFNVVEESEEEKEYGFQAFSYYTSSLKNGVTIRELREGEKIIGYETVYSVISEKPLEYSTAMSEFKKNGWQCSERAYELSKEEEQSIKEEYEKNLIELMRMTKSIPDLCFDVKFSEGNQDDVLCVDSYYMRNNSNTIESLLESYPEIADEVIKIIDEQIAEMDKIEIPKANESNEPIHEDIDFYNNEREEVKKLLLKIKEDILGKKAKEKISSQEAELSALEKEAGVIKKAENLVKVIGKDKESEQRE